MKSIVASDMSDARERFLEFSDRSLETEAFFEEEEVQAASYKEVKGILPYRFKPYLDDLPNQLNISDSPTETNDSRTLNREEN